MSAPGKILITGATGFVGSHATPALAKTGAAVRALVRETSRTDALEPLGIERVVGDLDDAAALRRAVAGCTAVVHIAAATRAASAAEFRRVNEQGTANLVRVVAAAEPAPRRLVYLSSLAAAGPALDGRPVEPADTPRPLTAYGRSKLAGEALCREVANRIEVVVLRAPAVYGPRDRDLFQFFRLAAWGVLPVPAGPARPLQLIHVQDLADAIVRAAVMPEVEGLFHVAEPRAYAWEEVARLIAQAVSRHARIIRVPAALISGAAALSQALARITGRPGIFDRDKARELLAPGWLCETDGARERLGFQARIPLKHGLHETACWYRSEGWLG